MNNNIEAMDDDGDCENDLIKGVMASMGWSDSFVPIASDENRDLLDVIKLLGNNKLQRNVALEAQNREVQRVRELFSAADNEFDQNLKLLSAHKSQYTTEHHLFKLSEHEHSKYKQILKETEKSQKELEQHGENLKNEKEKINATMEKLAESVQWAKTALGEWRQVMASGEETNKMIEKFCRMDAGHAEALDSKRKILHESIVKQQSVLVNAYEEKKALELLLERTGQLYRQAHLERRHLVSTWKDAVNQMNQREAEITETEAEIENAKKVSAKQIEVLKREESIMKLKQCENRDTELYIQELNIASSELRNRFLKLEDAIGIKSSELLALRKTVQNESTKLNNLRNQNRQMLIDEKDKENLLTSTLEDLEMMRHKYEKFKNSNSNAQERLRQIEELLETEAKNIKTLQNEIERLFSALYRSEQQLKKLQESEKNLMAEGQALESGISRTKVSCKNLEKELMRQTEILYNVDYNIQHAEMRLANMQGNVDTEESRRLDDRRKYLEKVYEDKLRAEEMMKTQIARVEEDMRKLSSIYHSSVAEFNRIVRFLKDLHCEILLIFYFLE